MNTNIIEISYVSYQSTLDCAGTNAFILKFYCDLPNNTRKYWEQLRFPAIRIIERNKMSSRLKRSREKVSTETCTHPAYYRNLCVSCGLLVEQNEDAGKVDRGLNMLIGGAGSLRVSKLEAEKIEELRALNLLQQRRLALVLDIGIPLILMSVFSSFVL
jgi:hypothetical protein